MAYKNAMKKTGIYQDRENGMLKNHGMLKDLGMMQEEGMRGMRRMRGMHQTDEELRAEMEAAKGPVPEMKSKPSRSAICIMFTILGFFLSVIISHINYFARQKNK